MNRSQVHEMTIEQLVDHFVAIALAQDQAMQLNDNTKFNRLFAQMAVVEEELKSRPGDQRRALLPLLTHANAQIRLKAAIGTLAIEPVASRRALQLIWDRNEFPQAADAYGMIRALDKGFIPA